jgi:hypothetical protein
MAISFESTAVDIKLKRKKNNNIYNNKSEVHYNFNTHSDE